MSTNQCCDHMTELVFGVDWVFPVGHGDASTAPHECVNLTRQIRHKTKHFDTEHNSTPQTRHDLSSRFHSRTTSLYPRDLLILRSKYIRMLICLAKRPTYWTSVFSLKALEKWFPVDTPHKINHRYPWFRFCGATEMHLSAGLWAEDLVSLSEPQDLCNRCASWLDMCRGRQNNGTALLRTFFDLPAS